MVWSLPFGKSYGERVLSLFVSGRIRRGWCTWDRRHSSVSTGKQHSHFRSIAHFGRGRAGYSWLLKKVLEVPHRADSTVRGFIFPSRCGKSSPMVFCARTNTYALNHHEHGIAANDGHTPFLFRCTYRSVSTISQICCTRCTARSKCAG